MKFVAPTLALFAAISALAAPATAVAAPAVEHTVRADLNGDGTLDRVAVRPVPNKPNEQYVVATVGQANYVARTELYTPVDVGVQPLRVVDVDDDGRDEVMVTESVGANTFKFTLWGVYKRGWAPVVHADVPGARFPVWESDAAEHFDRYGCEPDGVGGRRMVQVYASMDAPGIFRGERITYTIWDGYAFGTTRTSVTGPRDSSAWHADPQACA